MPGNANVPTWAIRDVLAQWSLNKDQRRSKQGYYHRDQFRAHVVSGGSRVIGFWCGNGILDILLGRDRLISTGRDTEIHTWIVNRAIEIGTLRGNALGDSCLWEYDSGNSVKVCPKLFLARHTLAWFTSGWIFIQLKIDYKRNTDKVEG